MIVTCVHIKVLPEFLDEFIDISMKNHEGTRQTETGNFRFDFLQDSEDPTKFMLYEVFESEEAIAHHKTTEHYLAWREKVNPMMAERRYGVRYVPLAPKETTSW
ncbi:MAG: antibiotic biosynthesis monooxygenase [Bacteroidota bacterium]